MLIIKVASLVIFRFCFRFHRKAHCKDNSCPLRRTNRTGVCRNNFKAIPHDQWLCGGQEYSCYNQQENECMRRSRNLRPCIQWLVDHVWYQQRWWVWKACLHYYVRFVCFAKWFSRIWYSHLITDRYDRVEAFESAFADVGSDRFIPYIQLQEYEALVFCCLDYLKEMYKGVDKNIEALKAELAEVGNPELVNDNPRTTPSSL